MSRHKVEISRRYMSSRKLLQTYKECNDSKMKIKLLALLKIYEGEPSTHVAEELKISDASVRTWLSRYNEHGLEGLNPKKRRPNPWKLSEEQKLQVKEILTKSPREAGFNRSNWTIPLLKIWIDRNLNIIYKQSSLYDVVHNLGFSLQRPRKENKQANIKDQEAFKDKLKNLIEAKDNNTVILYEDEAIITTEPTLTRKWSLIGEQPIVKTKSCGTRKRKVIYGAVNPEASEVIYSNNDKGNADNFQAFLK